MKRKLLLLLFILNSCLLNGQHIPVDSFYTPGATWVQNIEYSSTFGPYHTWVFEDWYKLLRIDRDTTISGLTYHVMYREYYNVYGNKVSERIGLIRTNNESVYFTFTPDNSSIRSTYFQPEVEYEIYDFSIVPGDSFIAKPPNGYFNFKDMENDSVVLSNGSVLPRYLGEEYRNLIYGIGSSKGLLGQDYELMGEIGSITTLLYCNSTFSYVFPYSGLTTSRYHNCDDLPAMSVKQQNMTILTTGIYPNPLTGDILHFNLPNVYDIKNVTITDVTGKELYNKNDPFKNNNDKTLNIPLPKGVYIIRMGKEDNSVITQKLTKW